MAMPGLTPPIDYSNRLDTDKRLIDLITDNFHMSEELQVYLSFIKLKCSYKTGEFKDEEGIDCRFVQPRDYVTFEEINEDIVELPDKKIVSAIKYLLDEGLLKLYEDGCYKKYDFPEGYNHF